MILEYDPRVVPDDVMQGPYFCYLLNLCDQEVCTDDDDCTDEECLGWYAVSSEDVAE